jgi:hypothetical protein
MRASKVIDALLVEIKELREGNERLTAALLADKPAAAAALRPRKEDAEAKAPVPRTIGL